MYMQNARIVYHYIDKNTTCINIEKLPNSRRRSV